MDKYISDSVSLFFGMNFMKKKLHTFLAIYKTKKLILFGLLIKMPKKNEFFWNQ